MGSKQSKSNSSAGSFIEYERIKTQLIRGDLIEIQRPTYKHWVIYEKTDSNTIIWCFHVSGNSNENEINGNALIKYEPLIDILRDNENNEPSLCRVNNQLDLAEKLLRKSNKTQPNIDDVFKSLHETKDTYTKYNFKSQNCEHFVTGMKYGIGWSSQVNSYEEIIEMIGAAVLIGVGAVAAAGIVLLSRK